MARPVGVVRSSASVSDTKPDAEMIQFLECGDQIRQRSSPAVQTPDEHDIDLAPSRCFHQLLPQFAFGSAGADFLHLQDDGPAARGGVLAHGAHLQRKRLLILCGDAGIQADPEHFRLLSSRGQKPVLISSSQMPVLRPFRHVRSAWPNRILFGHAGIHHITQPGVASRASVSR